VSYLCRPCDVHFASLRGFDRHRVGDHQLNYPDHENGRRCLTPDEYAAHGLELDQRGRWREVLTEVKQAQLATAFAT
jgi:hypothetical protein